MTNLLDQHEMVRPVAKLHFYYSAMNAGKSTILLQASYNYQERGMRTILLTPALDTRAGMGVIASRIGLEAQAYRFTQTEDLFSKINAWHQENPAQCVLVDEGQFLTRQQVFDLAKVCDELGVPVLVYGLRTDFRGDPFEGSQYLLALADQMIEIKTICYCGRKATMNMRVDEHGHKVHSGAQIEVGGNSRYVATCRKHFFMGSQNK
jgi:thymidine kinase